MDQPATLAPQTVRVQLSSPIEINGAKVGYLTMREPVWDDIIAARRNRTADEAERDVLLFASLTETPPEVIRRLPLRDVKRLQKAFDELSGEDFLP